MQAQMGARGGARHKRSTVPIDTESIRTQRRDGAREPARKGDTKKLFQLSICALIFLSMVAVKTFLPDRAELLRERLVNRIEQGTDYKEVFSAIGKAIGSGEGASEAFKNIYGEFFERDKTNPADTEAVLPERGGGTREDSGSGGTAGIVSDLPGEQTVTVPGLIDEEKEEIAEAARQSMSARRAALASRGFGLDDMLTLLPALPAAPDKENPGAEDTGDMLEIPDVVRMGYVELNIESTVPLKGEWSSKFGYRDHPVDGEYKFHYGLDIVGPMGASIVSYADGEVYEIGYNNTYGNYVRIKHIDGVTTFYAHCSKIFVKNGQKVKMGEKVAAVGQSGQVTGAHLHFEIRKDGKLIDPSYYLQ